jgi:hypothetical protein
VVKSVAPLIAAAWFDIADPLKRIAVVAAMTKAILRILSSCHCKTAVHLATP